MKNLVKCLAGLWDRDKTHWDIRNKSFENGLLFVNLWYLEHWTWNSQARIKKNNNKKTAHTELLQQHQLHKKHVLLAKTKKEPSEKRIVRCWSAVSGTRVSQEQKNWSMKLNLEKVPASFSIFSLTFHSKFRPWLHPNKAFNISLTHCKEENRSGNATLKSERPKINRHWKFVRRTGATMTSLIRK